MRTIRPIRDEATYHGSRRAPLPTQPPAATTLEPRTMWPHGISSWPLLLAGAVALAAGACSEDDVAPVEDPCAAEGATEACYPGPPATRGIGACTDGSRACVDGRWGPCTGYTLPLEESCEQPADENCNGADDEGCPCAPGASLPCYGGPSAARGIGACVVGTQSCVNGVWGDDCVGDVLPAPEACNEVDDDCNGIVDDGCACVSGATRDCYTGPPETAGVPPCHGGTQHCPAGQWDTVCTGEVTPADELCNGSDDDCDGAADEDLGTTSCGTGPCTNTVHNCIAGVPQICEPLCDDVNCTDGSQCSTGYCKDGRCCNTACTSPCQVCSTGSCASVTNGFDTPECAGTSSCDASGACKKVVGQSCTSASECVSGFCKDGRCCNSGCGTACRSCATGSCSVVANAEDSPECAGAFVCDGGGICRSKTPFYTNGFESSSSLDGWMIWHNCAADGGWTLQREPYPAPGGGSFDLRFHTTAFVPDCSYPGACAASPCIPVTPGKSYRVEGWSRCGGSQGYTALIFRDGSQQDVGYHSVPWPTDAWVYKANTMVTGVAPPTAVCLSVREGLTTASAYADFDLLAIYEDP